MDLKELTFFLEEKKYIYQTSLDKLGSHNLDRFIFESLIDLINEILDNTKVQ